MSSIPFALRAADLLGEHQVVGSLRVNGPSDLVSTIWSLENDTCILLQGCINHSNGQPKYDNVELKAVSGDILEKELRAQINTHDSSKSLPLWTEASK
jgi:hypothetical protein